MNVNKMRRIDRGYLVSSKLSYRGVNRIERLVHVACAVKDIIRQMRQDVVLWG